MMISAQNHTTDVIIIGAGLSGIGAAVHLQKHCPGKSYLILEARTAMGGTWDLFRYPGIRSDSDMHTLGYNFKPWTAAKAIADGPSILSYVNETVREHGITPHIRYEHTLLAADWSDEKACWTLTVRTAQGEQRLSCRMLLMCSGYYNYGDAYTPEFAGREQFKGQVVHPQHWPEHLDYRGKK
ncbi:MAG: NAD(P)/FAD-dependent oxidoreductase, partial [Pseudohongiella sp.]|nr:NAD(P)/FAD-dependent oxidoreductase [Pseudohongiella sp.]